MASSVDAKLLRQTKFPAEFNKKVDMTKVNVEVMKKWIAGKISKILGNDDDVVIELCFNLLEGSRYPDIKVLQIQLTGFLDKDTAQFCKELWTLCLSAQNSPQGVPKELLEAKKQELMQEKMEAERASEEARFRKEREVRRDRDIDNLRQRERAERNNRHPRGPDGPRNHYGDRGSDRPEGWRRNRAQDRSPSPPRRDMDTYVPRERGRRSYDDNRRRRASSRSPFRKRRSPSRSRSPPRRRRSYSSSSYSRSPPRRGARDRDPSRSVTPPPRPSHRKRRIDNSESRSPPRRSPRSPSPDSSAHRKRRRRSISRSPRRETSISKD